MRQSELEKRLTHEERALILEQAVNISKQLTEQIAEIENTLENTNEK